MSEFILTINIIFNYTVMNKIHSEGETPFVCDKESQNKKISYDPHLSPPDFSGARSHAQAARVCKPSSSKTEDEKCPCCGLVINNVQFPLNTNLNSIAHLGSIQCIIT